MEMKLRGQEPYSTQPPPYSPPEPSSNPAVITVPPAVSTHGDTQQTNSGPNQRTVVTTNIVIPKRMGPIATPYVCPSCNNMVVTKIEASTTTKQHLFAVLLCCVGLWPCAFIPYLVPSCRRTHHFCPVCTSYIGTYA